jgi:hypothetical protein
VSCPDSKNERNRPSALFNAYILLFEVSMHTSVSHDLRFLLYGEAESEIGPSKIELERIVSFGEVFKSLNFGVQTC